MSAKIIARFSATALILFIAGCQAKDKGKIISERHKGTTKYYLVNNSPDQIISFTILMAEKTSVEKIHPSPKANTLDNDSTNETAIVKLAPGARQYLGIAQEADTLNLDEQDTPFTYSTSSNALVRLSPARKGIVITKTVTSYKVVGATAE